MLNEDTICAISTPPGSGAIAIIRLSGANALSIAEKVYQPSKKGKILRNQKANTIHHGLLKENDTIIDDVMINIFRSPNSYTGEDVVEISCHGSLYIQKKTLEILTNKGARLAKPGEFTMRAFLNGKMDLSQAEAVADLIAGSSRAAHDVAINHMRGGFKDLIKNLRDQLLNFTSLIELELDFSEEDVEFADRKQLKSLVNKIEKLLKQLTDSFVLGNVIKNGVPVAIIGRTNAGKSTLLNRLLKEDRAIVSDIPGTTRDYIEDIISLEGTHFRFIDTAGLRDAGDKLELLGIEKTYEKINQASIILLIIDSKESAQSVRKSVVDLKSYIKGKDKHLVVVLNKTDLVNKKAVDDKKKILDSVLTDKDYCVAISAKHGKNIDKLEDYLKEAVNLDRYNRSDVIITNARHYEALRNAYKSILRVQEGFRNNLSEDLIAMDLRHVLHSLGEITGEITTDEILGNIFKNFCIGK
jgi:tRNA modification GTPase